MKILDVALNSLVRWWTGGLKSTQGVCQGGVDGGVSRGRGYGAWLWGVNRRRDYVWKILRKFEVGYKIKDALGMEA